MGEVALCYYIYCMGSARTGLRRLNLNSMKKAIICMLATAWMLSACGQGSYEKDAFRTKNGKVVTFYALGHSSIRMVYDGKEFYIDPVGNIGGKKVDYASMPKADYILVTHEHIDHYDAEAIKVLMGEGTQLIMNGKCVEKYGGGRALANGESVELAEDITVEAVPAYNTTKGHRKFHPQGRDNGYIITVDGYRIYVAGDTEDIPEMEKVKDIDVAFLPCNQPYTMTPEQLVKVAKMLQPKVLFPYHLGQTDVSGAAEKLEKEGICVRVRHYE